MSERVEERVRELLPGVRVRGGGDVRPSPWFFNASMGNVLSLELEAPGCPLANAALSRAIAAGSLVSGTRV